MILGYTRVSTSEQDTDGQRLQILDYAREKGWHLDEIISVSMSSTKSQTKRRLDEVRAKLQAGDVLICAELSRLGRSISEIVRLLDDLTKAGVRLICLREALDIDPAAKNGNGMQTKIMTTLFALMAEIERTLISERTKQGLAAVRAQGRRIGRPPGAGKSKLDAHKETILERIAAGVRQKRICKDYNISESAFIAWRKKHKIELPQD